MYTSKFFPIHKRDGKLRFLKILGCTSKFFSSQYRACKSEFLKFPCLHSLSNGKDSLLVRTFKLQNLKKKCLYCIVFNNVMPV